MSSIGTLAFGRYIGIDYFGAQTPTSSLKGLRVYMADRASSPVEVPPPPSPRKSCLTSSIPGQEERNPMNQNNETRCAFCGSERYETRMVEYLYRHDGEYLLVPRVPAEVCLNCGMSYYDGTVLEKIEQWFFAIKNKTAAPDRCIEVPIKELSFEEPVEA